MWMNEWPPIVSYRLSTSNHNDSSVLTSELQHCILSSFYIKPQLWDSSWKHAQDCILSSFYIKPQLMSAICSGVSLLYLIVFLHQTTTLRSCVSVFLRLYLIVFLHQTTTRVVWYKIQNYCILSSFYIKPQPCLSLRLHLYIVSYRLSTSNHNCRVVGSACNLIVSYRLSTSNHNPLASSFGKPWHCILSSFYIKPQRNAYKHLIIKHLKRYGITKSEMMSSFLLQIY